ncbi:MAG: hypothetical protein HY273_13305 [Gammaproteobacteria bacterium]|nr:hypothetical protein [Gammaproteobacteria bacterium]
MKIISIIGAVFLSAVYSNTVLALGNIKIDGFLSYVATRGYNDANASYDNGVATKDLGVDTLGNRLGLQFSAQIDPNTDVTAQFVARGGQPNYNVVTDFAYINYKPDSNWKIYLGKYKISQFLVSDYSNVGYAYPWVRPPRDVYSTNPLVSLSGIDVFYKKPLGNTNFVAQAFYGSGTHQTFVPAPVLDAMGPVGQSWKGVLVPFKTNSTQGFNVGLASDVYTLRIGYFSTRVDVNVDLNRLGPTYNPKLKMSMHDVWGSFGGLGFTMDLNNFVTYFEFISRDTAPEMRFAFPDQFAGYLTFGYRTGKFLPYVTYSQLDTGVDKSELALKEQSIALGLRYEVSNASAIKFEVMQVVPEKGNHGLFSDPVQDGVVATATYDVIF